MKPVLVFVPGLMGSELWDEKGKLWPGNAMDWATGYSDAKFQRLCAADLQAPDIVRKAVGIVDIYGGWIDAFSGLSDAQTNVPLFVEKGEAPTLITAPYDWRKSIAHGAVSVDRAVRRAVELHGTDIEIHLVAHSMGGLVSRYYLQSGGYAQAPGFDRIKAFLTFGTPHKGAVVALAAALGQHKADFMSVAQSRTLANNPAFQGLYNLFPQSGMRPVWERGGQGGLRPHDVFEPEIAKALKLNAQSLADTRRILDRIAGPWPDIRTFLFVGSRFETMTHVLWDGLSPVVVRTRDGGDGTVNLQGSTLEAQQIRFTDKNHVSLIKSEEARQALQDIFNAYGVLLAQDASISLSASDHFMESGHPIEILLTVNGPGAEVKGRLFLESARIAVGAETLSDDDFAGSAALFACDIRYTGPELVAMNVKFAPVTGPAAFRPVFETDEAEPRRFLGLPFLVKAPD